MSFTIANRGGVCSTIVVTGLIQQYTDSAFTTEKIFEAKKRGFIAELKRQIKTYNDPRTVESRYDHKGEIRTREVLDGYKVDKFAFFFSTIYANGHPSPAYTYDKTVEILRSVGFIVDTDNPTYNEKNCTSVYAVYGSVKKVLEELNKYDDNGCLIVQAEIEELKKAPCKSRKKSTE